MHDVKSITVHIQSKYKTRCVPGTATGLLDQHRHGESFVQHAQLAVALLKTVKVVICMSELCQSARLSEEISPLLADAMHSKQNKNKKKY